MKTADYVINLALSVFLVFGVYQFYFWCQRNHLAQPRELKMPLDDWIPYQPRWVWIYSFLYYPVILYLNCVVESPRHFNYVAMSYVLLLFFQMAFFVFFPVVTPADWRVVNPDSKGRGRSERFLAFVQQFDARSNCFPSMHVSVAMLTALHLFPALGAWAYAFPLLIGMSSLFTKQHYLVDLPAGAFLGWVAFELFKRIY